MLRYLVATSLKFRFLVLAIAVGMLAFGITQIPRMPVDVFPEFAPPLVEIQTPSLGLAAAEVEALVTIPLEEALAGMPAIDTMRSKSVPGLSAVKLYFKRGTNLLDARQMVQERISMVSPTLPSWSSPPVLVPPLSATSRMMKIGIKSDKLSVIDLSMITYWTIRQRLLRVPGVANIAIWGERLEMLQVQADPERMQRHEVSIEDLLETTSDALETGLYSRSDGHHVGTGGWIETPNQRIPIRHVLPYVYDPQRVSPEPLANTVLEVKDDGTVLLLKDVADVVIDHQPMIGDGIIDDGVGLLLIVEKFPWGNTLQVTKGVEEALDALRPGLPDVEIDHEIFRPATYIEMSMENLGRALVLASILVVVILFVFLNEWRVAVISCTAIPLSLMAGALDRSRGRRRRRDRGRREHPAAATREPKEDQRQARPRKDRHRGVLRGAQGNPLLDGDRDHGAGSGLLHGRTLRRLLPAARRLLCTRDRSLDHRRSDGDAGAELHTPPQPSCGGCTGATTACSRGSSARPPPPTRRSGSSHSRASWSCPVSGRSSCPTSRNGTS
jgi:Cu/Ag efflux pump CusA